MGEEHPVAEGFVPPDFVVYARFYFVRRADFLHHDYFGGHVHWFVHVCTFRARKPKSPSSRSWRRSPGSGRTSDGSSDVLAKVGKWDRREDTGQSAPIAVVFAQ